MTSIQPLTRPINFKATPCLAAWSPQAASLLASGIDGETYQDPTLFKHPTTGKWWMTVGRGDTLSVIGNSVALGDPIEPLETQAVYNMTVGGTPAYSYIKPRLLLDVSHAPVSVTVDEVPGFIGYALQLDATHPLIMCLGVRAFLVTHSDVGEKFDVWTPIGEDDEDADAGLVVVRGALGTEDGFGYLSLSAFMDDDVNSTIYMHLMAGPDVFIGGSVSHRTMVCKSTRANALTAFTDKQLAMAAPGTLIIDEALDDDPQLVLSGWPTGWSGIMSFIKKTAGVYYFLRNGSGDPAQYNATITGTPNLGLLDVATTADVDDSWTNSGGGADIVWTTDPLDSTEYHAGGKNLFPKATGTDKTWCGTVRYVSEAIGWLGVLSCGHTGGESIYVWDPPSQTWWASVDEVRLSVQPGAKIMPLPYQGLGAMEMES